MLIDFLLCIIVLICCYCGVGCGVLIEYDGECIFGV